MFKPFEEKVNSYVKWPSLQQWREKQDYWPKIPCAVAAIDGTSHKVNRPSTEPQEEISLDIVITMRYILKL